MSCSSVRIVSVKDMTMIIENGRDFKMGGKEFKNKES